MATEEAHRSPGGKNPFPDGDPRHGEWENAAAEAEEELARLHASMLADLPPEAHSPESFAQWRIKVLVAAFDIQAKFQTRFWSVLLGFESLTDARCFDEILLATLLTDLLRKAEQKCPLRYPRDLYLSEVSIALKQRRAHWKAEALSRARKAGHSSNGNAIGITEPKPNESGGKDAGPAVSTAENVGTDRRAAVDAYIEEVFKQKGKRITRTDIWKSARYKSRTEFERWERNDLDHSNKTAHERFARILAEKPHLK
jgi:hypothetical protein